MKQEERSKRTYQRILTAAIAEFGGKSYESASINNICSVNHIPKGLIYYNFENKDQLYLRCVQACFDELTAYLQSASYPPDDTAGSLRLLLARRQTFFTDHPSYKRLFFQTLFQPPLHLANELRTLRRAFDGFHAARYQAVLDHIELRDGISAQAAKEYFFIFQEMFNGYYQMQAVGGTDLSLLIENHESKLPALIDLMLYGVAKEKD
ncbi:TetR/AcrR family transcriptional regulator [Butyricicoccus faecihominis]|uniref:TetR/AcrR family transcriptional regulator n=1 Tax=Butyricicoccus faecihominis TaxID=1712515 RepID=UPI00247A4AA7|nr:TetR/AcrR family transcriptional regulator [Butyricicoccus faecihominis]MCQ5130889.1 TetR/AcrR family transcriptional regulator [Butyricicoccus faecihominis]MCQ5130894.1 TetR/AcrR family transcriptional regulator [Butyricicoccus faecihominis]